MEVDELPRSLTPLPAHFLTVDEIWEFFNSDSIYYSVLQLILSIIVEVSLPSLHNFIAAAHLILNTDSVPPSLN